MFRTTVAVIPKHIRAALDDVLDYAMPAEADDYRTTPKALRKGHIYTRLQTVHKWLRSINGEPDTLAIHDALEELGYFIAAAWHADDVKEIRPDLTDEQCREVMRQVIRKHNAEIGINWDVLGCHAENLFPESEAV